MIIQVSSIPGASCGIQCDSWILLLFYYRTLAELASGILYNMGSYNLITSSCQNFCDEFLKQLGSGGYWTYVKVGVAAAVVGGLIGYGAKLLYDAFKEEQNKREKK